MPGQVSVPDLDKREGGDHIQGCSAVRVRRADY